MSERASAELGFSRLGTAMVALACAAAGLVGCSDQQETLDGRDLEATLVGAMNTRLDGLEINHVDCVFLTPELTRCFAEGSGSGRSFRLPASVARHDSELVWSVAEDDLEDARRGVEPDPLTPGEAVAVAGSDRERVQVRVREPIDPLDVTYPEVPPKYGNRYVALPVELRNRGPRAYVDSPLAQISGRLSDGSLVTPAPLTEGDCASARLRRVSLPPGRATGGCVVFEVPDRMRLAGASLQLGYSENVLEWELQRSPA